MAISRFGSSSDFIARLCFIEDRLDPREGCHDCANWQYSGPRRRNVLTERVQATVINPPASIIAQKKGMNILADLPKLGLVYQHTTAATTRKYIREHADVVRRYVKSQVDAVHRIYTDKETSIKVLREIFRSAK